MTEYRIKRLGHHGDGIADGPLYAPMTLPGEVVTGTPQGTQLADVRIVTPSSQRVAAPCRHFKSCGGCQLQHASDAFVAEWKLDMVRFALDAQGLSAELRPILTSPAQSRRRATFAARRTKKGAMAGFHGRASDTIVEIPDCKLLDPTVMEGLPVAQALAMVGTSRKATLAVTVTLSHDGLDVLVQNGKPLDGPLRQELAHLCASLGLARLTWDDEVIAMRAPPGQSFGAAWVVPPPGAFLQATAHGEAALLQAVQEIVREADQVVDLFAGCGTFSIPLAAGAEVHAVEGDRAMMAALDAGWRKAQGLKKITTEARDLFRRPLMPDELRRFDVAVLDPPRAGAEAQVAEIARSQLERLGFVSCNPVTFARDASVLRDAGFTLDWVQVVDQFRWSTHIELVAQFTRPPQPDPRGRRR
ncbi:class I SAM-dependent RNA methyltransferase [Sulfitobacter sabulilitoris]|uniref:Class I SAM-dependent RNA methyltransferase n=1 Tax=Sulfitobacter sabulilitoris TaxID=2562655 RepID=A0A5S3PF18_9RHOB|nr:class I SAM-dependent RNA methyltransferase [Sulfitobacter sabulilitoris]TMM52627.1 class I SAM-dependent RNA methyltransferase [Sulfitobacter sabulilitoris]